MLAGEEACGGKGREGCGSILPPSAVTEGEQRGEEKRERRRMLAHNLFLSRVKAREKRGRGGERERKKGPCLTAGLLFFYRGERWGEEEKGRKTKGKRGGGEPHRAPRSLLCLPSFTTMTSK